MKEQMLRGEIYIADDPELAADRAHAQEVLEQYNATRDAEQDERDRLLRSLLGEVGEDVIVKPTFRCDYGRYISIGAGTFVNYDCVMLDVAAIRIGAACQSRGTCRPASSRSATRQGPAKHRRARPRQRCADATLLADDRAFLHVMVRPQEDDPARVRVCSQDDQLVASACASGGRSHAPGTLPRGR